MKIYTCALLILAGAGLFSAKGQDISESQLPRITRTINNNWTFSYYPSVSADKGYETGGFDDSRWQAITLPHTWNTSEFTGDPATGNSDDPDSPYWRNGWGWYRKSFTINQAFADRKAFIEFDGVQDRCKVWINGVFLGEHTGSDRPFDFDITPHIKKGSLNVIAVAVSNNSPTGKETDPSFYGGIFRNVRIILKNKLYIPFRGSSADEGGILISTPGFSGKACPVRIQTMVKNDHPQPRNCTVQSTIYDARGKMLQQVRSTQEIGQGQSFMFDHSTKQVGNPQLWSPGNPYLYKVVTEIIDGKLISDSISSHIGFRWFSWEGDSFYLNGKPVRLQGDKFPGIMPLVGNALTYNIIEDDFREAKNNELNFRIAPVPAGEHVYNLADRLGILLFETDEINSNTNHPSVFLTTTDKISKISEANISGKNLPSSPASPAEPARIVLTSRQKSIPARPGSVAIIYSSINDSKGNSIEGKNSPQWTIEGPAKLLSSSSDVNVVRCTGEPGKIRITAFSPALASGSIEITSVAAAETSTAITETVLREQGRSGYGKVIKPSRLEPVPQEIKFFSEAVTMASADKQGYRKMISELLCRNNSSVDTSTAEFRSLVYVLGSHLYNNKGQVSAADINYNIDHFNNCLLIAGYIQATKLPQPFKDGLRVYYSQAMILQGEAKDAGDEMNWLNWIPSGGTVVYCDPDLKVAKVTGTMVTSKDDLNDIITLVYPEFTRLSEDAKARANDFIARMNPWVHPKVGFAGGFTAERSKPVLIPLFKFIAE